MPVVRATRQIQPGALPDVRKSAATTPLAEGADLPSIGPVLTNFGATLSKIGSGIIDVNQDVALREAEKEKRLSDQAAVLGASNKLADWKAQAIFDPQTGALTKKGQDSFALPEQVRQDFNTAAGEIEKTMVTPEQKLAFARVKADEWQSVDLTVRRHVYGEVQSYRAGELENLVTNSVRSAIGNYQDPALAGRDMNKAIDAIRVTGPQMGMGQEQIDARVASVQSATHVGVIQNLLASEKDKAARVYFDAVKGQISGDKLDEVMKALEAGDLKGRAQRSSDEILRAGGTLEEQRQKAKAIDDPKERDEVLGYIEHDAAIKEKEERDDHETLVKRSFDILDRGVGVRGIPATDWAKLTPGERSGAWSYARQRAEGIPIKTDQGTFYQLMSKAGDTPQDFTKVNLMQYRAKLSDSDLQQLAGIQLSIKNGERTSKSIQDLAGFQTKQQMLENTLASYGIDPKAKVGTKEHDAIAALSRMVDRRVDALQAPDPQGHARKVSNSDLQGIMDELLGQGIDQPGSWWGLFWPGGNPGPWGVTKKRLIDLTVDDVPPDQRSEIERALRDRRQPITDQKVLDVFREMQVR